jgi:hypothetical protein
MSSKNDSKKVVTNIEDSPSTIQVERSNNVDSKTLNMGEYTFDDGVKRVPKTVKVLPSVKEKFEGLCRELGCGECELFEALVSCADSGVHGKAVMTQISRETYFFFDITWNRQTLKVRRYKDKFLKDEEILEEFHGDRDHCFICNAKAVEKIFSENKLEGYQTKHHISYVCKQHLKPELQRLQRLGIESGHRPI